MKKYSIGGRKYELRPLTLEQRKFAAPVWNSILTAIKNIAEVKNDTTGLIEIGLELDRLILSEDSAFEKFLATILTPSDAKSWERSMIEKNAPTMLQIDEMTQAEVLQDFLTRHTGWKADSNSSMQNSMNINIQSNSNLKQKDNSEESKL
ncbi:MAG: hypothetical protein KBG83_00175 [Bacteroidetes bacterium]|nr:hypothetical protein [Bacteroidota bacterium]